MRSSRAIFWISLTFTACFVFPSTAVNWSVDEYTVPEALPELLTRDRNYFYSDEEIEKAVLRAYKIQYDVIAERNGHLYDEKSPLGFFVDGFAVPKTRASSWDSNAVFANNSVRGLTRHRTNEIIVKWSQDRVSTEVTWKELRVEGLYEFLDGQNYANGKYQIVVEDVTYRADTPLSRNVELYPSSAPEGALSYGRFTTTSATGGQSIPIDISAARYFLEQVALRHVADYVTVATRPNVTSAIWEAVRPYVQYRNRTDPHFTGIADAGRLDDGRTLAVDGPIVDGLQRVVQKVRSVRWDRAADAAYVFVEHALHRLNGTLDVRAFAADGHRGPEGTATATTTAAVDFAVHRVDVDIAFDALGPGRYCAAAVRVHGITVWPRHVPVAADGRNAAELYLRAADALDRIFRDHLSVGTCAHIARTNKYHRRVASSSSVASSQLLQ